MTDSLEAAAVDPLLTTTWLGRPYHYIAEIGSTNDRLKEWVAAGSAEDPPAGTVLLTDYQSAGRGRLGRRWEAPPGSSLLFSALFRPGWPATRGGRLTMLAGLAVAEAIEATTGMEVGLKWPNDIMVTHGGQWRKVGGLLLDSQLDGDRLATAVLGVGLNVNIPAEALPDAITPATSLMVVTGAPVSRQALLAACLRHLEQQYDAADRGRSPRSLWSERLITLGQTVSVSTASSAAALIGLAEGTDDAGNLLVRDEGGVLHTIAAGDVTLRDRPAVSQEAHDEHESA